MIHTMLITTSVSLEMLEEIAEQLKINTDKKKNTSTYFSNYGFREISLFRVPARGAMYYAIEIKLNPKVMIEGKEDIRVTNASDFSKIPEAFNKCLRIIFGCRIAQNIPSFCDWACKRIDYAIDIETGSVADYIRLFKRAPIPSIHFSSVNRQSGSAYTSSKSVTLNFYDKEDEINSRLEDEYTNVTESDIENAQDTLRLEIQCKKAKINNLKEKNLFANRTIGNFINSCIARDIILRYYEKTIGQGDFYSLYEAEKLIKHREELSQRARNALCNTLKLISQTRSVSTAKQQFTKGVALKNTMIYIQGTERTFNKHINLLRGIGINAITIPRNWKIKRLENLHDVILDILNHPS